MARVPLQHNQELRLVLLGRTGAGMTSTANNILGEHILKERADTRSKTQQCESVQRTVYGRRVTVFDTPGFFNTEQPQKHTEWEIDRCVSMASPGPHAFLLVISMTNRFPPEAQDTIRRMEAKFGNEMYKYLIVIFTGKDTLDSERRNFTDFLRVGTHQMVEDVLRKCSNRCVAFNNKANAAANAVQVKTLLDVIDNMVALNNNGFFSAEHFGKRSQQLRRKIASLLLAIQEQMHFNVGMVPVFMVLATLMMIVFYIFVFMFISARFQSEPIHSVSDVDHPEILQNDTTRPPDTSDIHCKVPENIIDICSFNADDIRPTQKCIFFHIMLTALGRGFSFPSEKNNSPLPGLMPNFARPIPLMPQLKSYVYVHVMLNSIGRGVCLLDEDSRCIPQYLHASKPARNNIHGSVYHHVMLHAVGIRSCLSQDQTGYWDYQLPIKDQSIYYYPRPIKWVASLFGY